MKLETVESGEQDSLEARTLLQPEWGIDRETSGEVFETVGSRLRL